MIAACMVFEKPIYSRVLKIKFEAMITYIFITSVVTLSESLHIMDWKKYTQHSSNGSDLLLCVMYIYMETHT